MSDLDPRVYEVTIALTTQSGRRMLTTEEARPLLDVPRCEVLVYFPVSFLARLGEQSEFLPTMNSVFGGEGWREAFVPTIDFDARERMLLDLFMEKLRKRIRRAAKAEAIYL